MTEEERTVEGSAEVDRFERSFRSFVGQNAIAQQGNTAEAWALSSESSEAYDIFASIATGGKLDFSGIQAAVGKESLDSIDRYWLARLGRVVALRTNDPHLEQFALDALKLSVPSLPQIGRTMRLRRAYFELLYSHQLDERAENLLAQDQALREYYHGYLTADLINPFRSGRSTDYAEWIQAFNRPLVESGLHPVGADIEAQLPFDTLRGEGQFEGIWGPLVSVIVTSYNPARRELLTSVKSILNQTWRNLELILVDDCSASDTVHILEEAGSLDDRIRVLRLPENGGTYRARNAGIEIASGEFVTGQDADDWSHPQRLQWQIEHFMKNPGLPGVMTVANRTDDRLIRTHKGSLPERRCEVSLMFRRADAVKIGGYLGVRKAGDSEFRSRLEAAAGREVGTVRAPLYMIRLSEGSLSRGDFRGGWSHPGRRAFRSMYESWHRSTQGSRDRRQALRAPKELPFRPPRRISGDVPAARSYDVVFVADWRGDDRYLEALLTEVSVVAVRGLKVGLLQLESPFLSLGSIRDLNRKVGEYVIHNGVDLVYLDEEIHANLVLVRDPAVVHFANVESSTWSTDSLAIALSEVPVFDEESMRTFDPEHTANAAETIFGVEPKWLLPPTVDRRLFYQFRSLWVFDQNYPFVVDEVPFSGVRKRFDPDAVVVGRAAENSVSDWPASKHQIRSAYPINGKVDVRVLGDARGAMRVAGASKFPAGWLSFRDREVRRDVFWRRVDFCVQYDRKSDLTRHVREMLSAMAAGVVVIAEPKYHEFFGESVYTSAARAVPGVIDYLAANPDEYLAASAGARSFVREKFSGAQFVRFLSKMSVEATRSKEA